jgi:hypothetical protein
MPIFTDGYSLNISSAVFTILFYSLFAFSSWEVRALRLMVSCNIRYLVYWFYIRSTYIHVLH